MSLLFITRLLIAPLFVAAITLIGRRVGPSIAGSLSALPVVAGPILALLVSMHGNAFGARAALASSLGSIPTLLFALAYARLSPRVRPLRCLAAAYAVYFASAFVVSAVPVTWYTALFVPMLCWWPILSAFPVHDVVLVRRPVMRWDLPMRMLATLLLVAAVSHSAEALGPELAGIITPFPVITAMLAVFTHAQADAREVAMLLRALVRGLAGFLAFFLVIGFLLPSSSATFAFSCGLVACLAMHYAIGYFGIGAPRAQPA